MARVLQPRSLSVIKGPHCCPVETNARGADRPEGDRMSLAGQTLPHSKQESHFSTEPFSSLSLRGHCQRRNSSIGARVKKRVGKGNGSTYYLTCPRCLPLSTLCCVHNEIQLPGPRAYPIGSPSSLSPHPTVKLSCKPNHSRARSTSPWCTVHPKSPGTPKSACPPADTTYLILLPKFI